MSIEEEYPKVRTIYEGQRRARKSHECDRCGGSICKNEYFWTKIVLVGDSHLKKRGFIQQEKLCSNCWGR